jgi:hypothetical protein
MSFDDLPLERTVPPPAPAPLPIRDSAHGTPTRWIVAIAGIVVAGSALALWWTVRERPDAATPVPTPATNAAVASRRPKVQAGDLPSLDASDTAIRDMAAFLSHHPLFIQLLATKDLVRSATLGVQEIGDGKTPAEWLSVLKPETRVTIDGEEVGRMKPESYRRWTAATTALTSIRPEDAAQLYVNTKRLFDDAYRELGHPSANFDEAIVLAMQMLLATPDVTSDPELIRKPNYFEHYDPALRGLRPVQKEFLLIGPDNRHQVRAWMRALATQLDLKID